MSAFAAVGSNIEPETHIAEAFKRLQKYARLSAISVFYKTLPLNSGDTILNSYEIKYGVPGIQAPFLNGVVKIETALPPRALKYSVLRLIEAQLGRIRTQDLYAPRTLDLDLILYGECVLAEADLRLPDPEIRERNFIAVPLLELAPDLLLPDTGEPLAGLPAARNLEGLEAQPEFTARLRALLKE